jgi:predicted secreted protein
MPDANGRSEAQIGYGTRVYMQEEPDSTALTKLGEVTNVGFPDEQVSEVEVTHYESPDSTQEFIAGLKNGGSLPLSINWVPGSATDIMLRAAKADRQNRTWRIVTPPDDDAQQFTFPAFITGFQRTAPIDDRMTAEITLRVAGAVIEADAATDPTVIG